MKRPNQPTAFETFRRQGLCTCFLLPSLPVNEPTAKIKVDRSWVGAPESAFFRNPTVWLFIAA